jgi:hypothetical protein
MPLTPGELARVKAELGYNVLTVGAEPWIGVSALFAQVIQPYLGEGNDTTSATSVVAAPAGAFVALSVAAATGIVMHERVAVDVDEAFEMATVRSVSGTSVGLILNKAHAGTYPVTVDAGLVQVRECLAAIYDVKEKMKRPMATGPLKQVDEVEFHAPSKNRSMLALYAEQLEFWRDQLASALNVRRRSPQRSQGATAVLC